MDQIDVAIVGGGVVGLAIARALALVGREVVLLEAEGAIGMHTSSRNSEVVHAGIYYASGSLKARLCVEGRDLLYEYMSQAGVDHKRVGKLIVATRDEELPALDKISAQALANGVSDLVRLDRSEVQEMEPQVQAVAGLFSPSTGIVDSHGFMAALKRDAVHAGAMILCGTPVLSGEAVEGGVELGVGGKEPTRVRCTTVINAAGLLAPQLAAAMRGLDNAYVPRPFFAKGHYFVLQGRSPFRHLVYPVPVPGGLGVHVTLDLAGQARFGPDVSWVDGIDYSFEDGRERSFFEAIRRYYPELRQDALSPGYTGIRPKLGPAGAPAHDFVIQGPETHGVPGLVNLFGIESPGLTASLAIGKHVLKLLASAEEARSPTE